MSGVEPELYNRAEAAAALRVCVRTLDTLTNRGDIPAVTIGRARRYRVADVKRYAEELPAWEPQV